MKTLKTTPWSLDHPKDVVYLALGSAIGIGNFYFIPPAVLNSGGLAYLTIHALGLVFLGGALLLAELIWARWLQRPYVESFKTLGDRFTLIPFISLLAAGIVTPPYLVELGRLLFLGVTLLTHSGFIPAGQKTQLDHLRVQSYLGALSVFLLASGILLLPTRKIVQFYKAALSFCFISWTILSIVILRTWGRGGLRTLLVWDMQNLSSHALLDGLSFSLFTLSAGFGVIYTFMHYASMPSRSATAVQDAYWKRPGRLLSVAFWVLTGDFCTSLFSIVFVSPFAGSTASLNEANLQGPSLILDWLPQILSRISIWGPLWVGLLMFSLLLSGFCAALSLLDFEIYSMERDLRWSRIRAVLHVLVFGSFVLLLPTSPVIEKWMNQFGSDVLLPCSALAIALFVGWRMPEKSQRSLLGRSLGLDAFVRSWRFSLRYIVPGLLLYFLWQTARQIL